MREVDAAHIRKFFYECIKRAFDELQLELYLKIDEI
jgi:hypothetical protein